VTLAVLTIAQLLLRKCHETEVLKIGGWTHGRPQEVPQWGPGAEPRRGSGSEAPEADGILLKMAYTDIVFCTLRSFTA